MISGLGAVLAALVLLLLGGDSLVRGAAGLWRRAGLAAPTAGLLALLLASVAPEMALAARAAVTGHGSWALGLAIASAILVAGVGLGIALLRPSDEPLPKITPALAGFCLVAAGALMFLGRDGQLDRVDGIALVIGYAAAALYVARCAGAEPEAVRSQWAAVAETSTRIDQNLIRLLVAGAVLYLAANWLLSGSLSVPALSLRPEWSLGLWVAAPALALARLLFLAMFSLQGQRVAALQVVFATFLFNVLALPGVLAAWQPLPVAPALFSWAIPALLASALFLVATPAMAGAHRRLQVWIPALLSVAWWAAGAWRQLA